MEEIYEIVRDAIDHKKIVHAFYHRQERIMCPHTLGTKRGKYHALFYQFGGYSSSGLGPEGSSENWRCMFLENLTSVTSEEGQWHTAPNHTRSQTCVGDVHHEVGY